MTTQPVGSTQICKWKYDRRAAYSVGGDDSLRSQLFFAIPEMDKRGIRGTWWCNPGRRGSKSYKKEDDSWAICWIACYDQWKAAAERGHDFGNHTLHHLGASTVAEAVYEIGETARIIWETNPHQRLQLFLRGGGTTWGINDEEIEKILVQYDCVQGRGGGIEDPTWEVDPRAETLRSYVDTAIQEGSWHLVGFHGIGPTCEWGGPVSEEAFIALLDYLVEKKDQVWAGTHTEVHKYDQERSAALVDLLEASTERIRFTLATAKDPRLYNYPLTLKTRVPDTWQNALFTQDKLTTFVPAVSGVVQYQATPGLTEIILTPL